MTQKPGDQLYLFDKPNLLYDVAEIELSYHNKCKAEALPEVAKAAKAAVLFRMMWDENKIELIEQFKVMHLNRANRVLGIQNVSTGGIAGTVCDPKLVFACALKAAASGIILAHNHPSGNKNPSGADDRLTLKMQEAGKFLDLPVLDHLILTPDNGFYSYADSGYIL